MFDVGCWMFWGSKRESFGEFSPRPPPLGEGELAPFGVRFVRAKQRPARQPGVPGARVKVSGTERELNFRGVAAEFPKAFILSGTNNRSWLRGARMPKDAEMSGRCSKVELVRPSESKWQSARDHA